MAQILLFVAAVAGMFLVVPCAIWAATGSLRSARDAAKGFACVMAILVAPGVLLALIVEFIERLS